MKQTPLAIAPSYFSVLRSWYAGTVLCTLFGVVACAVIAVGWMGDSDAKAREASRTRLRAIGETTLATVPRAEDGSLDISRIEASLNRIEGILARVQATPALAGDGLSKSAPVSLALEGNAGFLILEGTTTTLNAGESGGTAVLFPLGGALLLVLAGCGLALRSERSTAGLRRVGSALAAIDAGETDPELLTLGERFGPIAEHWNRVITVNRVIATDDEAPGDDRRDDPLPSTEITTTTLDAIPYGIIGLDRSSRVMFCNGAAAAMLGVDRRNVLTETIDHIEALTDARGAVESVAEGERPRHTAEYTIGEPGSEHTLRVAVRGLRKTDVAHVLLLVEDVTQQRLADAARDSFVVQATHELRTPLTNIKLAAEEAIEAAAEDPATVTMSLNIVNQEARRLERVVSDMLSVSEMEAASMSLNIDDVDPLKMLGDLETDYRKQAADRSISLTFNKPAKLERVFGDREKIGLLLHNIVGNAIKYTPDGGAVTVTATQSDGDWRVEVRDTGPGIAPEEQEKVFEKFYRTGDAKMSDTVGSGLGLALAAEIAKLHSGEIILESEPGAGCTFTVRLPRGTQTAGSVGPGPSGATSGGESKAA